MSEFFKSMVFSAPLAAGAVLLMASYSATGQVTGDESIPANFVGNVVYEGNYEAKQDNPVRVSRRNPFGGSQRQTAAGTIRIQLNFNGNSVTGNYSGQSPLQSMTLNGTRNGNFCRLTTSPRPSLFEGECNSRRMTGRFVSLPSENAPFTVSVNAVKYRLTDSAAGVTSAPKIDAAALARRKPGPYGSESPCAFGIYNAPWFDRLNELQMVDVLNWGQLMANNRRWKCAEIYLSYAAEKNDIQGMAGLSYLYDASTPLADRPKQVFWCQEAYRQWKKTRKNHEIDAINHFCPPETIAALMTPAERQANKVSVARAEATVAEEQAKARAYVRSVLSDAIRDGLTPAYQTCRDGRQVAAAIGCDNVID